MLDDLEEVCIKVFAKSMILDFHLSSGFEELPIYKNTNLMIWWESLDNHPCLKRPNVQSWTGRPLRKEYTTPYFCEIQDAH